MVEAKKYQVLDSGNGRKLEQVGPYILDRPSAQAVWRPSKPELWKKVDARFMRTKGGEGNWKKFSKIKPAWEVNVQSVKMWAKLTDFGHIGMFPEHHMEELLQKHISNEHVNFEVLNLFAYTGSVSLLAAKNGAKVVHLDASKTSVAWAKENAELSGLGEKHIRWIVDDVLKFTEREIRRGRKYQGIFLDPPSFGRGAKGEAWKIEEHLPLLLDNLEQLLADDFAFVQLSAHSPGYTPVALMNMLEPMRSSLGLKTVLSGEEMLVTEKNGRRLPCGACAILEKAK